MFNNWPVCIRGLFEKRKKNRGLPRYEAPPPPPPRKTPEERMEEWYLRKGLQKFTIDGKTIWALNEKNARRKLRRTYKASLVSQ
jgi:hypothetical protein